MSATSATCVSAGSCGGLRETFVSRDRGILIPIGPSEQPNPTRSAASEQPMSLADVACPRSPDSVVTKAASVVVIVDPVSTGANLAAHVATQGHRCLRVWSDECPATVKTHTQAGLEKVDWIATVQLVTGDLEGAVKLVRSLSYEVSDVLVGCETGVQTADALAAAFGVRGNGTALSHARRNKAEQMELVRSAGLDALFETCATAAEHVEAFLSEHAFLSPFVAVVKPVEGAGSDGVTICHSADGVRAAYRALEGTKNVLGLSNYAVLLQEYLRGDE